MNVSTKSTGWYKQIILTVCAAILLCGASYAQSARVTGKVIDKNGDPLLGISVIVDGTTNGTATGVNGEFSLNNVPVNGVLEFSGVGYVTQKVNVNNRTRIDVQLEESSIRLEDVVVTAEFGLKRVSRSVGAAVQNLKGSDIAESGRDNFISALQGRVAGISVTQTSGTPGASTTVVLRNPTSISGDNSPLYVIDGIPMNNNTFKAGSGFAVEDRIMDRSLDFSSRGNDINPEDIENMTILKGAAAAALYGSNASNGAILITTKKGRAGKGRITYNNSFGFTKAYRYPDIQDKYDNGAYGTTNYYYRARFGQPYAPGTKLYDNIKQIFQTGFSHRHNISMDGGTENATLRASIGYSKTGGVVKTTDLERFNITLSGKAKIKPWLSLDGSMQYIKTSNTKTLKGTDGALYRAMYWPLTDDMSKYLTAAGTIRYPDNYVDTDLLNPLFMLYRNKYFDESERFISTFALNISPLKDWFIRVQAGWDVTSSRQIASVHPSWAPTYGGYYNLANTLLRDPSMDILTGYSKEIGKFSVSGQVGYHQIENGMRNASAYGEQFQVPDFQSINNCTPNLYVNRTGTTKRRLQAISAQVEGSYNNMLFLTLRARNDWSSTLPVDNRSYFYPAAEFSFIFTELPFMKSVSEEINYMKLRASVAQVGKDARPNSINPALEKVSSTGGGFRFGYTGPNALLRPEMNTAWETGIEARFFRDRMDLDFSYYHTLSKDQIISNFRMSYATGFVLNTMNIGTFKTDGVEMHIGGDIIKTKDWTFNLGFNWSKNWSEVTFLPENVSEYYNSDTWVSGNIRNGIQVGRPITSISGLKFQRNSAGQLLIDPSSGLPIARSDWEVMGDREPDLRYGFSGELRWKGFTLSALVSGQLGATIVNGTKRFMMGAGLSWESVELREKDPVAFNGVLKDNLEESANPTRNNISVNYGLLSAGYSGGDEDWIESNVNFLRINEIRLSYRVPATWLQKSTKGFISNASMFVTGNDIYTFTNYSGIDVAGNSNSAAAGGTGGAGFDMFSVPAPRTIQFGLSLTF